MCVSSCFVLTLDTSFVAIPTVLRWEFDPKTEVVAELVTLLTVVFATIFAIFLFFFAGWAFYLILVGETQIEFHNSSKPWNYWFPPQTKRNFEHFFMTGPHWWKFALPSLRTPTWEEWEKWNENRDTLVVGAHDDQI